MEAIIYTLIGAVMFVFLAWAILKAKTRGDKIEIFLSMKGFTPCEEETDEILEKVLSLERNAEYDYNIKDPYKASVHGNTVYLYQKNRIRRPEGVYCVEEFLIPLPRKSWEPFLLYLRPASVNHKLVNRLLKSFTAMSWDTQPDDLVNLNLPPDSANENLVNAFGPADRALDDLVDPEDLNRLSRGGDCGILVMRFHKDHCSFEYMPHYPGADLEKMWEFLLGVVESSLESTHALH